MFQEYPDVISVEQLCKMLRIGKNTAYKLVKEGKLQYVRIGKQYRISKASIIRYLNS